MISEMKAPINAAESRELVKIDAMIQMGMIDCAARSLSALIRCSRRNAGREFLMESARIYKLTNHPEFII